jgi:Ca2+-binding RTX toxin-like protein
MSGRTDATAISLLSLACSSWLGGVALAVPSSCAWNGATRVLSVTIGDEAPPADDTLSVSGTDILLNGVACDPAATTTTVDTISVVGPGPQSIVVDLEGGAFAPGAEVEASGTSEIEFAVTGVDHFLLYGTPSRDSISAGHSGINLNEDDDPDVVLTDVGFLHIFVFTRAGDDTVTGAGDGVVGEALDSILVGLLGPGDDSFVGGRKDDFGAGQHGEDTLWGGPGRDSLSGDRDRDRLYGGLDRDLIGGGSGPDVVFAGRGADDVRGGLGDDKLHGGPGALDQLGGERITGDVGQDSLWGEGGPDRLSGGPDEDRIYGGVADDSLKGGLGDDRMLGRIGDDHMVGGPRGRDEDSMEGGTGDDRIFGSGGGDYVLGGHGDDVLVGDFAGVETGLDGDDYLNADGGTDSINGGGGTDNCLNGESVSRCEPPS